MSISTLTTAAKEGSTYIITVAVADEDGTVVTPVTLYWSLTDASGNVINSRTAEEVESPAASNDIVLSGDDLAIVNPAKLTRELRTWGTYDSDAGTGLPFADAVRFTIDDIAGA